MDAWGRDVRLMDAGVEAFEHACERRAVGRTPTTETRVVDTAFRPDLTLGDSAVLVTRACIAYETVCPDRAAGGMGRRGDVGGVGKCRRLFRRERQQ